MRPVIAQSALRHGVPENIIVHVFNNPVLTEELDEGLLMLIGPDPAGNLYEIGVVSSEQRLLFTPWPRGRNISADAPEP